MNIDQKTICGIWISRDGEAHLSLATPGNERREEKVAFMPFAWADQLPRMGKFSEERLSGDAPFRHLLLFESLEAYRELTATRNSEITLEAIRALESQYLLMHQGRLFSDLKFSDLRRCQCDIETACGVTGGFSNPLRKEDRVLAIGLHFSGETEPIYLTIEAISDTAERNLLEEFNTLLSQKDPDIIEGHNIFNFDLDYLHKRSRRLKVACTWGRFGEKAAFRKSRLRVAERWVNFSRCDIPGRAVIDTYLLIQLFDITTRDLFSYSLKDVAIYLGITQPEADARTYLPGDAIQKTFFSDRQTFLAYLGDDLRETRGITDRLLPTYFAQTVTFPMTLQEVVLRGTASKVNLLLLEKYFHARCSLPANPEVTPYEGGYARSFATGVFKKVLHFDVASMYPSLLSLMGRNPASDSLGIFIPLLQELRIYRLKYKNLAQTAVSEELRLEYNARQTSFKILINSFYGYLGFQGARFSDSNLAAEITQRGRKLLQSLIKEFTLLGVKVLEADTDGIYLASEEFYENPERLLEKVGHILPEGIELDYGGHYPAMFCYKAKNYALYDGSRVTIRGSALRSRGMEPYLKQLTDQLIYYLLGIAKDSPLKMVETLRAQIEKGSIDITRVAKSEYLSQPPETYRKMVEAGNKPRRASLEVALQMEPLPKVGERVTYYIQPQEKGKKADWQRARALSTFDPERFSYDPKYYIKKIDDWLKRYGEFLEKAPHEK